MSDKHSSNVVHVESQDNVSDRVGEMNFALPNLDDELITLRLEREEHAVSSFGLHRHLATTPQTPSLAEIVARSVGADDSAILKDFVMSLYRLKIQVGDRYFSMLVDTGSKWTWLPSAYCPRSECLATLSKVEEFDMTGGLRGTMVQANYYDNQYVKGIYAESSITLLTSRQSIPANANDTDKQPWYSETDGVKTISAKTGLLLVRHIKLNVNHTQSFDGMMGLGPVNHEEKDPEKPRNFVFDLWR